MSLAKPARALPGSGDHDRFLGPWLRDGEWPSWRGAGRPDR